MSITVCSKRQCFTRDIINRKKKVKKKKKVQPLHEKLKVNKPKKGLLLKRNQNNIVLNYILNIHPYTHREV